MAVVVAVYDMIYNMMLEKVQYNSSNVTTAKQYDSGSDTMTTGIRQRDIQCRHHNQPHRGHIVSPPRSYGINAAGVK
jgi:hypothetical protein